MNPSIATQVPFVSVVIPAFRRTAMLRKAVEGVFGQTYPADRYEVFVVDSSPEEDNVRMLATMAQYAPCAFRFERKKPEGPGPSRNVGAFRSRGEFIAFLDSDCCPAADWIINGVNAFAEGIGLVQGRTLPDPAERLGIFKWYLRVEQETPLYETANIFYRRAAFEQTGGFPSDLSPNASHPMGGEDVSVAWKMKRLGWKSFFSAEALVYHEVVPLRIRDWIWIKHMYIWPQLLKEFPELRAFMFHSWFFDRAQAYFVLLLAAAVGAVFVQPVFLLLALPYCWMRASERTTSMRGIFRFARIFPYLARDISSFLLLGAGSIRWRCLLL